MRTFLIALLLLEAFALNGVAQTLLSVSQPAFASSVQTGNDAANGNDDSLATRWAASDATFPQWWKVDLGTPQNLSYALVNWYTSASRAYQYRIESSLDDTNYTVVVDNTANTAYGDTFDTFSTQARYVRVAITGATSGWAGFWECQLYGLPAPPINLAATAGNTVVNLAWTQSPTSGVVTNTIYRSTTAGDGPYTLLATLPATNAYSDTAVANGPTYYYEVSASTTNGESALSGFTSATPQTPPLLPYAADAGTLFLFHLDEASGNSTTTNLGGAGGNAYSVNLASASTSPAPATGVLGAASLTNFGNAASFASGQIIGWDYNRSGAYDGDNGSTLSADSFPMANLNMGNGGQTPWTLEAVICPSATNANQEIISTDSSSGTRGFQFRLNSSAQLELNLIAASINPKAAIPATGAHAFAPNAWFHVAAAYDGSSIVLYWTRLDAAATAANPIGTNAAAVDASFGAVQGPLTIGNENRAAAGECFQGLIDEVRISNIARAANGMLFVNASSGAVSAGPTLITPADSPIYAGSPATLSASLFGSAPITCSWQSDGATGGLVWTNLPGSLTNAYPLDTTNMAPGLYQFRLVAANSHGACTNLAASAALTNASGPLLISNTTVQPAATFAGNPVVFSASFQGTQPIEYQWIFTPTGGSPRPLSGATGATYTIPSAQIGDSGSYSVTAFNTPPGLGNQFASSTLATLTVLPDSTASGSGSSLFCELLAHPEQTTISARAPRFGWVYTPSFRNDFQTGYQIIVASSQALAALATGNLWDSGLVASPGSINIPYGGAPLQPGTSYFWRVRTLDSAGHAGNFSGIQQFNTAAKLSDPLSSSGVIYQLPANNSTNCYPLRFVDAAPILVTNTAAGVWFADFGQDAFGYATLRLSGSFSGTTLQARFGEMAAGYAVNTSPSGSVRYGATTLALQSGDVTYPIRPPADTAAINPPATFGNVMPFRYLQLTNCPGTLTPASLIQKRLVSEFDLNAAAFASSSPNLNQIWSLCRNSMQWLTFDGIYVDGDRERKPYEADAYIQQLSSYAVQNDFTMPRCTFEYLASHPTWPTEWKSHMIFIAWADYLQTGNADLLNKYYATLQLDSFTWAATGNGLMQGFPGYAQSTNSDIVDWPAGDRDGFTGISSSGYRNWTNSVNNAFYYRGLRLMANIAAVIGRASDANFYTTNADQLYKTYNATFWNTASQNYVDGVGTTHSAAHANFFPLAFGLVPASNQAAVVSYLHSRIAAAGGMPPSVYGAQYLLEGLFQAGDADTALGLIVTNGPRGWMNMLSLGSTLTDEAWSFTDKSNEDWNHAWGSAAGNLIARYVLGLRPLAPGFGQILIQPQLGQTLNYAQGTIPTIRGPVFIQASNAPGSFQLLVSIPGNVTATVMLPASNTLAILDGAAISGTLSNGWLTLTNLGSGLHALWSIPTNAPSLPTRYNNWAASWFGTNSLDAGQLADPDADGINNYAEFIAGTDPTDPGSRLSIGASLSPGSPGFALVTLAGLSGRAYTLQRSLSLTPPSWTTVYATSTLATNQNLILADPNPPASNAFYRVQANFP